MRLRVPPLAALTLAVICASAAAADAPRVGPDSGEPVPRFVSLRTAGANGRHGPSLDHRVDWIYERPGLPLQVTAESGPWRRVRDPDGGEVWMHARNLDPKRTAFVAARMDTPLRSQPKDDARVTAYLAPGVIGALTGCEEGYRRIAVGGRVGWVPESAIWGEDESC